MGKSQRRQSRRSNFVQPGGAYREADQDEQRPWRKRQLAQFDEQHRDWLDERDDEHDRVYPIQQWEPRECLDDRDECQRHELEGRWWREYQQRP